MTPRMIRVSSAPREEPRARSPGYSPLAIQSVKEWKGKDRPKSWVGRVWGLVVHTTGGGLPERAKKRDEWPTVTAVDYYSKSHGCHYVNGWRGKAGGDLIQMANEGEQANGVGVTNQDTKKSQWDSVHKRNWEQDLPGVMVRRWHERWDHTKANTPLDLFPTKYANSCYVHCECPPMVYYWQNKLYQDPRVAPIREGARFTLEQHDTVALLALDIAERNGFIDEPEWWLTGRLVGHEDITPVSRSTKSGGWDPGWLRSSPYFDWGHVYKTIELFMRNR